MIVSSQQLERTHIFKGVLKINALGNGHTILCNLGRSIGLSDDCIASLRSQGYLQYHFILNGECSNLIYTW